MLAVWLRTCGYRVGSPVPAGPELAWLERWSIPLADIQPPLLEAVLTKSCTRADGAATVASVARRRRNQLATMLRTAVRRRVLATNPMDRVEWRIPQRSLEVDVTTVPSPAGVRMVVARVAALGDGSARYAALFACVGLAGMRPSEAIALAVSDVDLPATGWGSATLQGAVTSPGTRQTATGDATEAKGLKQRARDWQRRRLPRPVGLGTCVHADLLPAADAARGRGSGDGSRVAVLKAPLDPAGRHDGPRRSVVLIRPADAAERDGADAEHGGTLPFVHGDDFEPYRGRWVARSEADDAIIAAADSLEELDALLDRLGGPKVFVHRVPLADEPLYIGLG